MNAFEVAAVVASIGLLGLVAALWRIGSQLRITNMLRAGEFKSASISGVEITPRVEWSRAQLETATRKIGVRP
jgi:hypothetical protein